MKLWTSAEIQSDVSDAYRKARIPVEQEVNRLLKDVAINETFDKWAFIAIVRKEDHPDYQEIVRKSSRGKCVEFRLKILHSQMASASHDQIVKLIFAALSRSVLLMSELGVSADTQNLLQEVLSNAERNVRAAAFAI
jgi:hypothetical protein